MKDVLTIILLFEVIFILSIVCLGAFVGVLKSTFKQIVKEKVEMVGKKKHLKVSDIFQNLSSGA